MILKKLEDINDLRKEIAEWKKDVTRKLDQHEASIEVAHKDIAELKVRVDHSASSTRVQDLRNDFESECIKSKAENYKYDIVFTGIPGDEKSKFDTEEVLRDFLKTKMKIEPSIADYILIADAYRIGLKRNQNPRNILAKFVLMSDRDNVFKACRNLKAFQTTKKLDNGRTVTFQTYRVEDHIPPQLAEEKRALQPAFRQAAEFKHRRHFRIIGAKICLFINGYKYIPGIHEITAAGLVQKPIVIPSPSEPYKPRKEQARSSTSSQASPPRANSPCQATGYSKASSPQESGKSDS